MTTNDYLVKMVTEMSNAGTNVVASMTTAMDALDEKIFEDEETVVEIVKECSKTLHQAAKTVKLIQKLLTEENK